MPRARRRPGRRPDPVSPLERWLTLLFGPATDRTLGRAETLTGEASDRGVAACVRRRQDQEIAGRDAEVHPSPIADHELLREGRLRQPRLFGFGEGPQTLLPRG